MRLLYGTTNSGKLQHMREMLNGLDIEIIGLDEVGIAMDLDESGNHPLENARIKAIAYYRASGMPTFSCDSGLYIKGLEGEKQPGVYVRRINDKYLNDDEFIEYYADLVLKFGGVQEAEFKNAICLVLDEEHIFEHDGDDIADRFLMTSKPHDIRKPGFPMDSISLEIETGKYIIDAGKDCRNEKEISEGFRDFFIRTFKTLPEI